MGAILIKLISNPIQAEIHEAEEIVTKVPSIKQGAKNKSL